VGLRLDISGINPIVVVVAVGRNDKGQRNVSGF
jgi:hypothetical protein